MYVIQKRHRGKQELPNAAWIIRIGMVASEHTKQNIYPDLESVVDSRMPVEKLVLRIKLTRSQRRNEISKINDTASHQSNSGL